jgi:hypothetical protein
MQELKFIAFKGKSIVSKAIRYFTRSRDYSHVAILMPDSKLIEAWDHQGWGQWTDYSTIAKHTKGTKYEIWELEVSEEAAAHCMGYYQHHADLKTPYDYFGVAGFIFKKTTRHSKKKLFCSELCITPLCEAKGWDKITPNHISPESFVDIIQAAGGKIIKEGKV